MSSEKDMSAQRDPELKRKAWLAVFAVSALFWLVVALLAWKFWG